MKNRTHKYEINRPRHRHGHKYAKYKMCLIIIMIICIKQHRTIIGSSIHEKVILTGENFVLLSSVQEWLLCCFWSFPSVCMIN